MFFFYLLYFKKCFWLSFKAPYVYLYMYVNFELLMAYLASCPSISPKLEVNQIWETILKKVPTKSKYDFLIRCQRSTKYNFTRIGDDFFIFISLRDIGLPFVYISYIPNIKVLKNPVLSYLLQWTWIFARMISKFKGLHVNCGYITLFTF